MAKRELPAVVFPAAYFELTCERPKFVWISHRHYITGTTLLRPP